MLLLSPVILAYGIIIPLIFIKFLIQRPLEYLIIEKARKTLKKHPALKIAVAGSFGKTTMREILKTVLSSGKKVAAPGENYNTLLGISNFVKDLKGDEEVLIFELGEYYKGDIEEMCQLVRPDVGIITGVNEAHLEKFKRIEATVQTIFELADWLGEKPLYVNGENILAKKRALKNNIIYGKEGVEELRVENMHTDVRGTTFTLNDGKDLYEFNSKLLGLHQVGPLVAAIHIARTLGMSIDNTKRGIASTRPFDHRLEPKTDGSGVTTIDDSYNGNPDGVKAVIEFLSSLTGHRRFYVTPGLVEMGHETHKVHREIGRQLGGSGIEKIILVKNSVTPYIGEGLKEVGYGGEVLWFEDGLSALHALPYLTVAGDVVLLQNDWPDQYY